MNNPLLQPLLGMQPVLRQGISEYQLIKQLQQEYAVLQSAFDGSHFSLFESHFVLFNALYQLRDIWLTDQVGHLCIHTLNIELRDYTDTVQSNTDGVLTLMDGEARLRDYYLDWQSLQQQSEQGVERLLKQFWEMYCDYVQDYSSEQQQALQLMGLQAPVDRATVRQRYRSLAMQWHPDRGGSTQQIQALNQAMRVLQQ